MYPTFHHALATARVADLHRRAAQERTAKAACRAQPRTRSVPAPTVTGLARWAVTLAHGHSPAPTR